MSLLDNADQFLQHYSKSADKSSVQNPTRTQTKYATDNLFELNTRSYQQQYGDMYFLRLAVLKPVVEKIATDKWMNLEVAGERVRRVERVLDVRQGELCWVTGTVYMEMSLKPNILDDISRDHFIAAPPPRNKYRDFESDQIMLEDESGRLKLTGDLITDDMLVTGCVIAVMGTENSKGDFVVSDILYPDLTPQTPIPKPSSKDTSTTRYVAFASGLAISGNLHESLETHLMVEFLTGELAALNDQKKSASISRLVLAGSSLAEGAIAPIDDTTIKKSSKKYGYDSAAYNPKPTANLDALMFDLCSTISVTIMPGETDPANVSLPQQRIHPAMFPASKAFNGTTFTTTTNPCAFQVDGIKFLGTSGQTISDIYKYVDGENRLEMMEKTLRWRHIAPTAPDTLWCYPYQDKDQFIIEECPHVYFVGNQPKYETNVIQGDMGQDVRLITIPKFSETGQIVLLDLDTLECEVVNFKVATKGNMY